MLSSKNDILKNSHSITVEELWVRFKSSIETGISKFVPVKHIGSKKSLPWVTKSIKKLIHKRDKLYQKLKHSRSNQQLWTKFKKFKTLIKSKIKCSYDLHLENLLDIADSDSEHPDTQNKFSTKKLYNLIKNSKQDSQTISPLKDQQTGNLKSNNIDKANILNTQF